MIFDVTLVVPGSHAVNENAPMSSHSPARPNASTETADSVTSSASVSADLLTLLTAEYTQAILQTIQDDPEPAREIAEQSGASRPTVYRRLNELEAAGLVESKMTLHPDGNHRTVFEATLDSLTVALSDDGYSVDVTTECTSAHP